MNHEIAPINDDPGESSDEMELLTQLRQLLGPLDFTAEDTIVPRGLADRTIRRVLGPVPIDMPCDSSELRRHSSPRHRWDVAVAASIFLAVTGLTLGGLGRLSQNHAGQYCRANLMRLFHGLESYASTHNGKYPEFGQPSLPNHSFVAALAHEGVLDPGASAGCPAVRVATRPNGANLDYAYAMGYKGDDGKLHGPIHTGRSETTTTALVADRPISGWVPRPTTGNHVGGANVLFADGSARFCNLPTVGFGRDHIYVNQDQRIAAGLHPLDAVLGEKDDRP